MHTKPHFGLFQFTLWTLLSISAAFGSFELAEAIEFLHEITTEDATHQDLDEEALAQLASSIKSETPCIDALHAPCDAVTLRSAAPSFSPGILKQVNTRRTHDPSFLPLY
jgi:hypothetical protein